MRITSVTFQGKTGTVCYSGPTKNVEMICTHLLISVFLLLVAGLGT